MTKKLTFKKAKALALREVEANPDFVYSPPEGENCSYVHHIVDGVEWAPSEADFETSQKVPGCIVGRMLVNFGLPIDEVAKFDLFGEDAGIADLVRTGVLANQGVEVTPKACDFLFTLQTNQDIGHDWRSTYLIALDAVPSE